MQVAVDAGNVNPCGLVTQQVVEMQVDFQPLLRPVLPQLHHYRQVVGLKRVWVCPRNPDLPGDTGMLQSDADWALRRAFCPVHMGSHFTVTLADYLREFFPHPTLHFRPGHCGI